MLILILFPMVDISSTLSGKFKNYVAFFQCEHFVETRLLLQILPELVEGGDFQQNAAWPCRNKISKRPLHQNLFFQTE